MARYKEYDYGQLAMVAVNFERQIVPGTFEYALHKLIDEKLDLSVFDALYKNDETGAPAYDPAILLKIILYAYSKGVTSSRGIEQLCCENVIFMALAAHSAPHFTTIADFIATRDVSISKLFREVLLVCDEAGLIGREMFAVDGVKLPSNASKEWSGTKEEFAKKVQKMERAVTYLMQHHRETDSQTEASEQRLAGERQMETLRRASEKVKGWLAQNEDKIGAAGRLKKSNITDNESAKPVLSLTKG